MVRVQVAAVRRAAGLHRWWLEKIPLGDSRLPLNRPSLPWAAEPAHRGDLCFWEEVVERPIDGLVHPLTGFLAELTDLFEVGFGRRDFRQQEESAGGGD